MRNDLCPSPASRAARARSATAALAVAAILLAIGAASAGAQCCACQGCGGGFCVDEISDAVACAELCEDSGCPNQVFQIDDTCAGGCDGQPDLPTATPSGILEDTPTATPTATGIPTGTATATVTASETPTDTPIDTPTGTPTGTAAATVTTTATPTATGTPTGTAAATVTATATHTPAGTPTGTAAATITATATHTPTGTPTGTAAATITATATRTASNTPTTTLSITFTNTPTLTPTPSVTPTPTGGAIRIQVGTAVGRPGTTVGFAVTLEFVDRFQIVATRNLLAIDPAVPFARTIADGPDCTVDPALQKPDSSFTFLPSGCDPADDCEDVDAQVSGPAGSPTIPAGSVLYSCRIAIPEDTEDGTYPLACQGENATDIEGASVRSECLPGEVIVQTNLTGDCNGDGVVTIDELILGVNISLGSLPITDCPAFDTDRSGDITIDELIQAVNNALVT